MRCTVVVCGLLAACEPAPSEATDRRALASTPAEVVLDPTGVLGFEADGRAWRLRFPAFDLPSAGEHRTGSGLELLEVAGQDLVVRAASIAIERFGPERVVLRADPDGHEPMRVDAVPALRRLDPARVIGARPVAAVGPREPASADEVVFAALGSAGTGLPGQRRVAEALARVARREPIDFVLLLGDQFYPSGVGTPTDAAFTARFDTVYDAVGLPMPFWFVLGDAEHRGSVWAIQQYSGARVRWSFPDTSYDFELAVGDAKLHVIALDTRAMLGGIENPVTRRARSLLPQSLQRVRADWRVVAGHDPIVTHSPGADRAAVARLHGQCAGLLERDRVDVYLSGGDRNLQLIRATGSTLHVACGGGAGPEAAESVEWRDDTLFAATGGGFVVVRIAPRRLELSFHDADGATSHVHRVEKP